MLVKGRWHEFPGETVRPIIEASVLTADGEWEPVTFLLDAGADRTVLEARLIPLLTPVDALTSLSPQLGGVGGLVGTVQMQTRIRFFRNDGDHISVKGPFAVFTESESSDISLLGRDVTNNFDVIYSHRKSEVLLLHDPHTYVVQVPF